MILRLLFPSKCVLCGRILEKQENDLCRICRTETAECPIHLPKHPYLDSLTAVWYYEGNVRSSLLRYKFGGARSYADSYGRLLAMKILEAHPEGFDILTWVPVSPLRKFQRGYDQVELLAVSVGRELNLKPVRTLKKIRHNRRQSSMSGAAQRRANVIGVYRASAPSLVQGKRVLLLDDILTTGATAGEAARILLSAGAKEVHCGVIAVTPNHE